MAGGAARGGARTFGHPEVFAVLAAGSFLAARFLPVLSLPYACPSKALLGLPCATCGMTHAFVALARLDLAGALAASPLGAALAAGAWLYALLDLGRLLLGLPFPDLPPRALRAAAALGVGALLANWAWLLAQRA